MKNKNAPMPANEFGKLRSHLAKLKIKQADIDLVIGTKANNRTRAKITQALKEWLKTGVV